MRNNQIIIGLVGEIAAGKGTAAKYLKEKYGAPVYKFSTAMRDIAARLYLEETRRNLQDVSAVLRKNFGEDLFARVINEDVKKDQSKIIVVDGIRRLADIKYLKELKNFKLVYITAPMEIRYQRIIARGENSDDKNKTFADFVNDHQHECENEISLVVAQANFKINNSKGEEDLYKEIEKIIL
jgi:dephospho-CoA kinase